MSAPNTDPDGTRADERAERYAELAISAEEFVIYDRENHRAWIQTDAAVSLAERC
ncbi:MAG: hypothetical protein ABEJ30_01645 [Halorientalis sp.]